jgi:hypothetical protein
VKWRRWWRYAHPYPLMTMMLGHPAGCPSLTTVQSSSGWASTLSAAERGDRFLRYPSQNCYPPLPLACHPSPELADGGGSASRPPPTTVSSRPKHRAFAMRSGETCLFTAAPPKPTTLTQSGCPILTTVPSSLGWASTLNVAERGDRSPPYPPQNCHPERSRRTCLMLGAARKLAAFSH